MNDQETDDHEGARSGVVMRRREALRTLAGGAVTSVFVLAGCSPNGAPPTPIATSTPTPWVSPTPAASADNARHDDPPTASPLGTTQEAGPMNVC
jgi:hypothetical protein